MERQVARQVAHPMAQAARCGAVWILAVLGLAPSPADAHGGVFPPVPPAPPADAPARPEAPPPAPSAPTPKSPAAPVGPGPSSPAGPWTPTPTTPKPGAQPSTGDWSADPASWRVWWRFNQDEFLELRARLDRIEPWTGGDQFFAPAARASVERRATATSDVHERIVPALLAALRRDASVDLTTSALVALGRVGEAPNSAGAAPHSEAIAPFLRHARQEVAETAALALGILGSASPRSVDLLSRVALGDREGLERLHRLALTEPIGERTRCFAIYGLGLLGEQGTDRHLRLWIVGTLHQALLEARAQRSVDLGVAAVTSLGLVPLDPRAQREPRGEARAPGCLEEQLELLFAQYTDPGAPVYLRANVPIALARLLERGAEVTAWRERILRRLAADCAPAARESAFVQRGAVQALGRAASAGSEPLDVESRAALLGALESRDLFVRRFALIALARAGSNSDDPSATAAASDEVRSRLIAELASDRTGAASWAALALGVLERRLARAGGVVAPRSLAALLAFRRSARTSEDRGACALALGLIGDGSASEVLETALAEERNPETQGDLALALGLLGERSAVERVRGLLERSRYQPSLMISAATGLGLLADVRLVPALVDLLARSTTQASQGAVAAALGRIGDARSIDSLVELSRREDVSAAARAFGVVALGLVGERTPLPWRASLTRDFNYTAATPTLLTPETSSGVLDIL